MKTRLLYCLSIFNALAFCTYLISFTSKNKGTVINYENKILKVKGIVVVDSLGIERVMVGSHLPEPNSANGNRFKGRGKSGSVSGVMLYDAEGQERGGYVTDDYYGNAFLSLDSKSHMPILLIAEPQGAGSLILQSGNGKHKVNLGVSENSANIQLNSNGKDIKLHEHEK